VQSTPYFQNLVMANVGPSSASDEARKKAKGSGSRMTKSSATVVRASPLQFDFDYVFFSVQCC
jgi:hypothetical protein